MRELTSNEVEIVSGGIFGALIVDAVKLTNDLLNTATVSSVGKAFDTIGLGSIHYAADSIAYSLLKAIGGLGGLLGGDEDSITYHFEYEWGG